MKTHKACVCLETLLVPHPKKGEKETIKTKQNEGNFLCKNVHVSKKAFFAPLISMNGGEREKERGVLIWELWAWADGGKTKQDFALYGSPR